MGLREEAAADTRAILEDSAAGFGVAVTVTSPLGVTANLTGFANDIPQAIDPQTGTLFTSRVVSAALPKTTLLAAFGELPVNVPDKKRTPWVVRWTDAVGKAHSFKVREARPDDGANCVVLMLEALGGAAPD